MRILFVMDAVSTIVPNEDTTYGMMVAATRRGHQLEHCLLNDVRMMNGEVWATHRAATPTDDRKNPVSLGQPREADLRQMDAILIRKDPPFDASYLWLTLMLERLRGQVLVVNDPRGLREANEKLYACHFPELMPETLVASNKTQLHAFVASVGGRAILKPVDGHAGRSIFLVSEDDPNFNVTVEMLSDEGRRAIMAQRYLPEVREGDKRVLILDGKPLGAILRIPKEKETRSNIHVGGRVAPAALDDDDLRIVETIAPRLEADGLIFVGIDVIGGRLTEINVTSPTGIQQMSEHHGKDLSEEVIVALEKRVAA